MKKTIITLLITILLLTACQPTPTQTTIASKNKDLVQEVVEANKEENKQEIKEDKKEIIQQIESLDRHLTMQIDTTNPLTKINVDAEIKIPQYETIPFVRLRPKNFTIEQFNKFIKYLAGGNKIYYRSSDTDTFWLSKEEIEAILPKLKGYAKNKALEDHVIRNIKRHIKSHEEGYGRAISKQDEKAYDGAQVDIEEWLQLKAYMGCDRAADFVLTRSENNTSSTMRFTNENFGENYNFTKPYEKGKQARIKTTYNEAKQMAEDFIKAIDGDDTNFVIVKSSICTEVGLSRNYTKENGPQAYLFSFARRYNGVDLVTIPYLYTDENVNYRERVQAERLSITIDDRGIVSCHWGNYLEYVDTIANDVPLLEFDKVQDVFEQYCKYKFTWSPTGDNIPKNIGATIDINRIELNLMVTAEKDSIDTYLLIPVWDFIGDITYSKKVIAQDGYESVPEKGVSILTVSAIDGTVINREQGY